MHLLLALCMLTTPGCVDNHPEVGTRKGDRSPVTEPAVCGTRRLAQSSESDSGGELSAFDLPTSAGPSRAVMREAWRDLDLAAASAANEAKRAHTNPHTDGNRRTRVVQRAAPWPGGVFETTMRTQDASDHPIREERRRSHCRPSAWRWPDGSAVRAGLRIQRRGHLAVAGVQRGLQALRGVPGQWRVLEVR